MSDEVKSLLNEIKQLAAQVAEVKKTEDLSNPEYEKKFDKMVDQLTKMSEKQQALDAEKKAVDERLEKLESTLNRKGVGNAEVNEKVAEHKQIFNDYLRNGQLPNGMKLNRDGGIEIRAMSTDVNYDGGYLVMPELASFIVGRSFETSPIRQIARVVNGSAKSLEVLIDDDEADASWVGEGSASSDTDTPELGKLEIFAEKLDAEPHATSEMLEDSYMDVEAWLREKVADKFARKENTAFVVGTGVNQPRGFMTFSNWTTPGTYERNKIEQIASGATATLTGDGLISLQNSLQEEYQAGATFLMKRASFGAILKLKGSDNYFFSATLLKDGQSSLQLLGKPVRFCDDIATVGAGNLAIAYGDFRRGYTIYDRRGILVIRDNLTSKPYIKFYVSKRVGGNVTNFEAIKVQKVAVSV